MPTDLEALKTAIGEARFACVELGLYLDTHPEDEAARNDYNCYGERLRSLLSAYTEAENNLLNFGQCPQGNPGYILSPWPWQLQ